MPAVEYNVHRPSNGRVDRSPYAAGSVRTLPADAAVAVVSDGTHGVGPEIVRRLAVHGMRVVLATPWAAAGHAVIDSLGALADRVAVREVDTTDEESVATLVLWLHRQLGRCDLLVNNATEVDGGQRAGDSDLDAVRLALEKDLLGPWRMVQAIAPLMRSRGGGRIVNVCAGDVPGRVVTAAVGELTRLLAAELAEHQVLVNAYAAEGNVDVDALLRLATLPEDGPTGEVFSSHG